MAETLLRHLYPVDLKHCDQVMRITGTRKGCEIRRATCIVCGKSIPLVPIADQVVDAFGAQRIRVRC